MGHFLLILVVLFIRCKICDCKRSYGLLVSSQNWEYIDRFCFVSEIGNLHFIFMYPVDYQVESLYLYYDTASQWNAVYGKNLTCHEKEDILDPSNNQQIRLSSYEPVTDHLTLCRIFQRDNENWYRCEGNRRFISQRSRWWFLALGNCNSTKGLYLEYDITMTNGDPSEIWFYQLSADEFYILPVNITFLLFSTLILLTAITVACVLRSRHLFHQTFKLYLQSIICECFSLFLLCAAYGRYAQDGIGIPFVKLLGQIFRAASTISFLFLLLLLAKGYTITRGRLSNVGAWKMAILISLFIITYLAMFIWQIRVFDPARITYISESLPGYVIVGLRVLAWIWYCTSAYLTVIKYPLKRNFYFVLSVLMTLWFWMGPISVIIANFLLDNWVREEVVNLVDCSVVAYGYLVFMVLTWPSSANANFPYHVRTAQIGDSSSPANDANYPQNAYEVIR
uniref:GpcrRhopsn4 domain-containing protein n=1 Tax=Ascaris lumbricoides TaxID=6252 RepID=A0A0M3HMK4_ASCLU